MSNSSRDSQSQTQFRSQLYRRDSSCIVTDDDDAEAAHILPQSRPEYYQEIFGYDPVYYFDVSYGLLLSKKLHHRWDNGDWALYPDPADADTLIVHIFEGTLLKQYHGQKIPLSRFHRPYRPPNRQLLDFHYRQCILKHIRGFEIFPSWQQP